MQKSFFIFNFKNTTFILLSIIALSELSLRAKYFGVSHVFSFKNYSPQEIAMTNLIEVDQDLIYKLKPNLESRFMGKLFSTNHEGNRKIVAPGNAAKSLHIFGRSIDMGEGVADNEAWPAVLAQQPDIQKNYNVINHSVSGYQWPQIVRLIERTQFSFSDSVFIPFYLQEWQIAYPNTIRSPNSLSWQPQFSLTLFAQNFFTYQGLRFAFQVTLQQFLKNDWQTRTNGPFDRKFFSALSMDLPRIVLPLVNKKIPVILLIHPNPKTPISSTDTKTLLHIKEWARRTGGVKIISDLEKNLNLKSYRPIYFGNLHPSAEFHSEIARGISSALLQ